MTRISFRGAAASDAEAICQVLRSVSDLRADDPAWEQRRGAIASSAWQWRVGIADGRILTVVQAAPSAVWFGRSRIRWADVGDVSVVPELQGRGLGSQAMTDVVEWMRAAGYAVTRLGGLTRFYSRFGYQSFPRQYVEFPVYRTIRAGALRLPFPETIKPAFEYDGQVRSFDEQRDAPGAWEVAETFTLHRTGCRVFERPAPGSLSGRPAVVFEQGGRVRGIAAYRIYHDEVSAYEAKVTAYQLAYEPGCPEALDALVKHLLRLAYSEGAGRLTALLPPDDAMVADLGRLGGAWNLCQTSEQVAGNMIQILSLRALLECIEDELSDRAGRVAWRGSVCLDIDRERAALAVERGTVALANTQDAEVTISMSQAEMLRMVLGIMPPVWPAKVAPDHPAYAAMAALFPPLSGGFNT